MSLKSHAIKPRWVVLVLLATISSLRAATSTLPSVPTAVQPVTNEYHGVRVVDDYQWIEDASAPAEREWVKEQNQRTRAYFARLPYHDGLAEHQGTLHIFEVDTGKELPDIISRVQYPTAGGSAAWTADGSGILYTRYPHQGERPEQDLNFFQQVWYHRLGTPVTEDKLEMGKDFPRIAEIELETSEDGKWVLATVANGDGGDYAHYLRSTSGEWRQITRFEDGIKAGKLGRDGALYLLSRNNAPRGKVLRVPLEAVERAQVAPEAQWERS